MKRDLTRNLAVGVLLVALAVGVQLVRSPGATGGNSGNCRGLRQGRCWATGWAGSAAVSVSPAAQATDPGSGRINT